jgi:hypothetical protein
LLERLNALGREALVLPPVPFAGLEQIVRMGDAERFALLDRFELAGEVAEGLSLLRGVAEDAGADLALIRDVQILRSGTGPLISSFLLMETASLPILMFTKLSGTARINPIPDKGVSWKRVSQS